MAVVAWVLWELFGWTGSFWRDYSALSANGPVAIFTGVIYGCERLDLDHEAEGVMHWIQVDLAAPGIELYVTPLDRQAVRRGWQYRLQQTEAVVRENHLAVAINGTLFTSQYGKWRRTGDLARAIETAVADYHVNHVWEHAYLLWFDDELNPRLETTKPPSAEVLEKSWWGIGGQGVGILKGVVWEGIPREPIAARTAVGIDHDRRLLWLAVFENASPRRALEKLASLGAQEGMLLDGGDSSCMVLGAGAQGVPAGVLGRGGRPVATHFGIRAKRLRRDSKSGR
jgi:hypothetical protein